MFERMDKVEIGDATWDHDKDGCGAADTCTNSTNADGNNFTHNSDDDSIPEGTDSKLIGTKGVSEKTVNNPGNDIVMHKVMEDKSQDFDVMSVGAMYTDGPLSVSIGHIRTEFDDGEDASASMLSASYTLAPGVAWKSSVFTGEDSATDSDGTGFVTGIKLNF